MRNLLKLLVLIIVYLIVNDNKKTDSKRLRTGILSLFYCGTYFAKLTAILQ